MQHPLDCKEFQGLQLRGVIDVQLHPFGQERGRGCGASSSLSLMVKNDLR